ncbi:MAG: hypothetical protein ABSE63_06895 [Thermoguttaceae bacterium]|jgi:hypothetical protein
MFVKHKATGILLSFMVLCLLAAPAFAGLIGTGLSYNDGTKTWEGTKTFSQSATDGTLAGSLDWAVFTGVNFSSLFTGYTPTGGELVYAYQLTNTGTVNISLAELTLLSSAPADNVGDFTGNGVSGQLPKLMQITSGDVIWDFGNPDNIVPPNSSAGLAVSSIRKPRNDFYVILNGGASATVSGIGGPGTSAIPEPSVLTLLAIAIATMGFVIVHRRKN